MFFTVCKSTDCTYTHMAVDSSHCSPTLHVTYDCAISQALIRPLNVTGMYKS